MDTTTWDFVQNVFLAFGGLGLFLLGLKMMSDGLKNIAGSRMRSIIKKATANRFVGLAVGMIVTAVIQSSTATSVMGIGFVNAGLMKLTQFASIIIGANVGSTFTTFLISFKIDPIAPLFIFIGIVLFMFFRKKKIKDTGYIILGLGILFFGLSTMGTPLKEFSQMDGFQRMLIAFQNPILALFAGLAFTAIIQSSAATIGIIITMYFSGVDMSFETAAFLVLGANVGTCSTALISSLAASRESKRAALIHTVYNIITCVFFGALLSIFPGILEWFKITWQEEATQVAMFHTIYNVGSASVMIFFTKQLVKIVYIILPKLPQEEDAKQLIFLDAEKWQTPEDTFAQAHNELCRMGRMARKNMQLALEAFYENNAEKAAKVMETEEAIDYLKREITGHLMRIQSSKLSPKDVEKLGMMLRVVSDIERVGDHAENIAEYAVSEENHSDYISMNGMGELSVLGAAMLETLKLALAAFETRDASAIPHIYELEQKVDNLTEQSLDNHIRRLQNDECDPRGSVIFTSMASDLERCADHAVNIATSFMNEKMWSAIKQNQLRVSV